MFNDSSEQARLQKACFDRNEPYRLQIECTSECSADCAYCYARVMDAKEPLTTREIKSLIRQAANLGIKQVDWMGGDPLERPDWIELMQSVRYAGMTNNLWTCGPLLNDIVTVKRVIELTQDGFVMVHLDSLDPKVLSSLRYTYHPRQVRATISGLELLLEAGKSPCDVANVIMLTAHHTPEDVKKTMDFMYRRYRISTCLMSLKPVDERGSIYSYLPRAEDVSAAYRLRDEKFLGGRGMGCQDFPKHYCGTCVFVSQDGRVSSCYSLRRTLGDLREQSLEEIVRFNASSLFFTPYRENDESVTCSMCDNNLCWGCRANAFYFAGSAYSEDPLCSHSHLDRGNCPY
ncbi:MAG TPA: radical SAM protein [Methanomassiliicoccaceae archaeon]|nr:radical SAM protein [Euryarchaeota archaeon]HOQ25651.1 radical SAM protein [Methanomassiliicoccaceae archaeon]HQA20871.1 radical SAM protein [Methanomassiliicoccaceae archaeon]